MSCAPRLLIPLACALALTPAAAAPASQGDSARRVGGAAVVPGRLIAATGVKHVGFKPGHAATAPSTSSATTPNTSTIPVTVSVTDSKSSKPTTTTKPAETTTTTTTAAPPPSSPSAAANPPAAALRVGIYSDAWGYGNSGVASRQAQEATTGVKWLRENISWASTEATKGTFDWSHWDLVFAGAAQQGLHVLPLLTDSPSWAAASEDALPGDASAYANFVAKAVGRYGPHGSFWVAHPDWAALAPDTFELWNEPYFAPNYNPAQYAQMVKAATTAGRAADSSAKFSLAAETTGRSVNGKWLGWVDALYQAVPDLNNYFDVVVVHPYGKDLTGLTGGDGPNQLRRIELMRSSFVSHGAADKGFWFTEVGYSTCGVVESECVTPAEQASDLQTMFTAVRTTYAAYVRAVFVYRYNDLSATQGVQQDYGLTAVDGSRKPAFAVLQANA